MKSTTCQENVYHQLFMDLVSRLRSYLYYHCGDQATAEDLTQEAFIKLWEHCKKVPPDKAKAFLYRVGYNMILDLAKHKKVVRKFEANQVERSGPNDPQFNMEQMEFEQQLWSVIGDMPENNRVVFLLNRIDGLTYKQIAATLGLTTKAVEKRMQKALQEIRKIYPKF